MSITIDGALELAKHTKETMDWGDLDPMLHLVSGDRNMLVLIAGETSGPAFWLAICDILQRSGDIDAAVLICDARMRSVPEGEQRPPDDDLQRKWLEGDRDGITECLMITKVNQDGTFESLTQPYDAGSREWGEVDRHDHDEPCVTGGVIAAMQAGLRREV